MPKHGEMAVCKYCGLAIVYRFLYGIGTWVHYIVCIPSLCDKPEPKEQEKTYEKDSGS